MHITFSPDDREVVSRMGIDLSPYLTLLGAVESPSFTRLTIQRAWSLLVCQFAGPETFATCALSLDLLALVQGDGLEHLVVADSGLVVDRRAKIVEELVKRAEGKARLGGDARELKRDSVIAQEQPRRLRAATVKD